MDTQAYSKFDQLLRLVRFPLIRILLLYYGLQYLFVAGMIYRQTFSSDPMSSIAMVLMMIANLLAIYVGFVVLVERRPVTEFALPNLGRELGAGLLLGFGLYAGCVLVALMIGIYRIDGVNTWQFLLPAIWSALAVGVFEELLFRGVILRVVEEWLGSWAGLIVSSLAFGFMHMANPQSTLQGAVSITIAFGLLLGATYIMTRRLWLGMGFHIAWNYTQSAVFSGTVSGNEPSKGLIKFTVAGPDYLTGGSFGMEASLIAFLLCSATGVAMLIVAIRRGKVLAPSWQRGA